MPYPPELEEEVDIGGRHIRIRPIRPEDETRLHAFSARLTPEDVRMRFLQPLKRLPQPLAQRLSRIDYQREMALIACEGEEILGVVRLSAEAAASAAEFALIVRSDRQRLGLGRMLMTRLLAYAWSRGLDEVYGDVLVENTRMLDLCRSLGCEIRQHPEDSMLLRAVFRRPVHRSGA